jgi:pyrroloquinoline-quinone synthase
MQTPDVLSRLDARIQSRSILGHRFYVAWQNGTLTSEQLSTYARLYWPHVAAFPTYLENAVTQADDAVTRAELEDNLRDERHHPKPHAELWLDFGAGVGADRQTLSTASAHPAATRLVETISRLTATDIDSGLGALYAYESQQPEVSSQKAAGLREHYGVTAPDALAYFTLHAEMDLEHREKERDALARRLDNGGSLETVEEAVDQTLEAYWGLLDGVCEEAGITG